MDLDERISRQPGSHLVRVPRKQIQALQRERDAYMLKAQAWDRYMRQQARRRQVERTARAVANNPKPRV